ncbi:MAG: FAD-dependent cmnm(5)s(2)U34 oxidoreductase, partial [Hyphomonas sp. 32-62-5]
MTRLLTHPEIEWREDGTPVATAFGDVYFSVEDGLAETRAVFLNGCGLPDAWAGRRQFTVAETGFGTGLNFLALWQLWREHRPHPRARLSFVSFEGFPLRGEDAARA